MVARILIVDDSPLFREGLRASLKSNPDWEICGEAGDGFAAITQTRSLTPHLIVMDLSMPYMGGIEAASEILKEFPRLPILLLTLYMSNQLAEVARNVGIRATLSKKAMRELPDAIHAVLHGATF
ncbi:MAG TPA: response regulator transcription factor [Candidatus Acidoferrales bacterium]|nr:response regulator transcription factor [Candidatus Acidoferrales bacterium]